MGIRNANQTKNFTTTGQILTIIRDESLDQRLYVDNYLKNCQQNGSGMPPDICHE